jgi:pantothenate kinase
MDIRAPDQQYNPYRVYTRDEWARLRDDTPMTLEPGEFDRLRSLHDRLDLKEVEDIYLPLSRLCRLRRGRKVHHGARSSGAAGAMVAEAESGPDHDRRVSVPECRAGAARDHAEEGLSGEL